MSKDRGSQPVQPGSESSAIDKLKIDFPSKTLRVLRKIAGSDKHRPCRPAGRFHAKKFPHLRNPDGSVLPGLHLDDSDTCPAASPKEFEIHPAVGARTSFAHGIPLATEQVTDKPLKALPLKLPKAPNRATPRPADARRAPQCAQQQDKQRSGNGTRGKTPNDEPKDRPGVDP